MSTEPNAENPRPSEGRATELAARRLEMAARRRNVATLLLRRISQREIARLLQISTGTVSTDLKAIREEWKAEARVVLEDHIARELAVLNTDEQYWRSQMVTAESMDVRLKMYDRVLKIMDRRADMLGLNAPIRLELARMEAEKFAREYGLDAAELVAEAQRIMEEHARQ